MKFRQHFVATFRQLVVTYRKNVRAAQPTAVRIVYCVIASNSVFSSIIISRLGIFFGVIFERLNLKGD